MILLLTSAATCWALVGLIWTIQLVHYPLMSHVTRGFGAFHAAHTTRITWLVGPLMGVELVSALALLGAPPAGVPTPALWLSLGLVLACWALTGLLSVPLHQRLASGPDAELLRRLVQTNWPRTLCWTARGILLAWLLWRLLPAEAVA